MLIARDIKNSLGKRFFILLFFLVFFQTWFVLTSDAVKQAAEAGQVFYMAAVFSFNFFGSIAALTLNYDGISCERESKMLDLILTSGVSKKKIYMSKVLSGIAVSGIFAVLYVSGLGLVFLAASKDMALSLNVWRYALPIMAFLSVFSLMGLMLSVFLRSSKASLVTSVILGGLLMPGLFVSAIDGLCRSLGIASRTAEVLYLISPALIINALSGYSEKSLMLWGLAILAIYLAVTIIIGNGVFARQDELNYGE